MHIDMADGTTKLRHSMNLTSFFSMQQHPSTVLGTPVRNKLQPNKNISAG
jgi:hypothetical protein